MVRTILLCYDANASQDVSTGTELKYQFVQVDTTTAAHAFNIPAIVYSAGVDKWMKLYISPVILSRLAAGQVLRRVKSLPV